MFHGGIILSVPLEEDLLGWGCDRIGGLAYLLFCAAYWSRQPRVFRRLTHWGRVTHICVGKLTIIASDNGLSPGRRQAIIWTNDGILLIGPMGTNFSEMLIEINTFSFKKMSLKVSSAKWRPFSLGLNVLSRSCYCCFLPRGNSVGCCIFIICWSQPWALFYKDLRALGKHLHDLSMHNLVDWSTI